MTDIGNCVPSPGLMSLERAPGADLDAKFAAAKAQPAGSGVTAGADDRPARAPARHRSLHARQRRRSPRRRDRVRARLSRCGPTTPASSATSACRAASRSRSTRRRSSFHIPPNTRFYKTFLKQVVDTDGSLRASARSRRASSSSRPDTRRRRRARRRQTALFGTYKWNDDESERDARRRCRCATASRFADTRLHLRHRRAAGAGRSS